MPSVGEEVSPACAPAYRSNYHAVLRHHLTGCITGDVSHQRAAQEVMFMTCD